MLSGTHGEDISMFFLSGDSHVLKKRPFVILRSCAGRDVAVKATIGTLGKYSLNSPI
jgi:hypothetical protein